MENDQPEKPQDQTNNTQPQPQLSSDPVKCSQCKTFFGTAATNFMCSQCFKKNGGILPQTKPTTSSAQNANKEEEIKEKVEEKPQKPVQVKQLIQPFQEDTTKCWMCQKKIGLTGVKCRCDYYFCSKHRYPEEHSCEFDFNGFFKEKLAKENQKVVSKKVDNF